MIILQDRYLEQIIHLTIRSHSEMLSLHFTEEQVKAETARCLGCGASVVDPNKCIGCGICTTKCEFECNTP